MIAATQQPSKSISEFRMVRLVSTKYVYDRMKLCALVEPLRKVFLADGITSGHAIILARLSAVDQRRCMDAADGLFDAERGLYSTGAERKSRSVRELQGWVDKHVRFDAGAADPMLFPDTIQVVTEAKEAEEKIIPITYEHYIPPEAREGRTFGPRSWKRADGGVGRDNCGRSKKSKPCAHAVTGFVAVGRDRGEAFKVCVARDRCRIHWGQEIREKARKTDAPGAAAGDEAKVRRDAERRQAEERRRAEAAATLWEARLPAILAAVAAAVSRAPTRAGGLLAKLILDDITRRLAAFGVGARKYVPLGTTAEDLVRHAAFVVLMKEASHWGAHRDFPKRAKAFGVDVQELLTPTRAMQTSAEPSAGAES